MNKPTTLRIEALHIRLRDHATGETQEIVYDPPAAEPKATRPERPKAARSERAAEDAPARKPKGEASTEELDAPERKTKAVRSEPAAEELDAPERKTEGSSRASAPLRAREGKRGERATEGESAPPRRVPDANITLKLDNETSPPATKIQAVGRGATTWIQDKSLLGKPWGRDDKGAPTVVLDDAPDLVEAIKAAHPGLTVDLTTYSSPAEVGAGPGDLEWKQAAGENRQALVANHNGNEFRIEHAGGSNHALFYVWGPGRFSFLACGSIGDLKSIAAGRGPTMPAEPDPALASELCQSACKPQTGRKRAAQRADRIEAKPPRAPNQSGTSQKPSARPAERKAGPVSDEDAARFVIGFLPDDPEFRKLNRYIPETQAMEPWGFRIVLYQSNRDSPGEKRIVTVEVFDNESMDVTWDDAKISEKERSIIMNVIGRAVDAAYDSDSHVPTSTTMSTSTQAPAPTPNAPKQEPAQPAGGDANQDAELLRHFKGKLADLIDEED